MQEIYEYALNKQKEHLSHQVHKRHLLAKAMKSNGNGTVNLTVNFEMLIRKRGFHLFILILWQIWDLQVDNSSQTIDVIYYLEKDGILLPYEDALKVMSFVSDDYIHNQTGYEVVDKIRRKLRRCTISTTNDVMMAKLMINDKLMPCRVHRRRAHLTASYHIYRLVQSRLANCSPPSPPVLSAAHYPALPKVPKGKETMARVH